MITNKDLSIDRENGKITLNGNKYDLGTQGEIDAAVDDIYSVMGQNGAKNLIPYPYYRESGYSLNGMTTTYDSDGVLTINKVAGSSTAFFALTYTDDNYCLKPNTKYKLLVEFDNTTQLSVFAKYGDTDIVLINKKSTGKYVANFTTPQTLEGRENIAIYAAASDTETNAKVKVMIMLASDTDDTYQPYAKTNKELTEVIGDLTKTGVTGADVAEQIGALYEAITSKDNTTEQQLNIYKSNNMVFIYGYINNLDPTQTVIAYATLDAKYKPASNYAIGAFISATAPYLPIGSVWVSKSAGGVHIYKEAAATEGYVCLVYMA